ncbi:MAG: peptidase family protein [Ilumatobacteraceae bacterium]|nr:peptidase family protein [Ilumatobacteraceae bacterium]
MTLPVTIAIAAAYGLLFGSFLTVVVDRVPRGASIVRPGSACGACGLRLGARDLVPVFSWVAQRGRCRRCCSDIGVEPLVLEVTTAGLFALFAWHFRSTWELVAFCALGAGLVALTAIDLRTKRLPREITYATAAVGAPLLVVAALVRHEPQRIWTMACGAGIALAITLAIYVVSRGGMGDGDVRLAPLLGMYLGWLNPGLVPVGLLFGFFAGALVGGLLLVAGRAGRTTAIPLGPFLALGTVAAVFCGQAAVDALLRR